MAENLHRQKMAQTQEESDAGDSSGAKDEIYAAVYSDVMKEVRQNLSQMKPQLIQEIADAVMARIEEEYGKRLKKLDSKASKKNRQDGEGKQAQTASGKGERIDVSELDDQYKVGGWIYYPNPDDGEFLYKVRPDGSDNTQLTDYAVWGESFLAEGGYLYFDDLRTFTERKIKLED